MQLYTINDLIRGAGIFDFVMETEVESPTCNHPLRTRDAIGIVAAAFASGLPLSQMDVLFDGFFHEPDSELLLKTRAIYDGDDKRFHLWNSSAVGREQLNWELRYYSKPQWRPSFSDRVTLAI
jgi:hypothetical protein